MTSTVGVPDQRARRRSSLDAREVGDGGRGAAKAVLEHELQNLLGDVSNGGRRGGVPGAAQADRGGATPLKRTPLTQAALVSMTAQPAPPRPSTQQQQPQLQQPLPQLAPARPPPQPAPTLDGLQQGVDPPPPPHRQQQELPLIATRSGSPMLAPREPMSPAQPPPHSSQWNVLPPQEKPPSALGGSRQFGCRSHTSDPLRAASSLMYSPPATAGAGGRAALAGQPASACGSQGNSCSTDSTPHSSASDNESRRGNVARALRLCSELATARESSPPVGAACGGGSPTPPLQGGSQQSDVSRRGSATPGDAEDDSPVAPMWRPRRPSQAARAAGRPGHSLRDFGWTAPAAAAALNGAGGALPSEGPNLKQFRQLGEGEKIFDLYSWDQVLQEDGDGGKVVVCQPKKRDGEAAGVPHGPQYVMKIRSKKSLREAFVEALFRRTQERMLNFPPHVGVVPICEVLETEDFYYVVMEKASGGPLFDALLKDYQDGVVPAWAVKRLMTEILNGLGHVHRQGMLHRDIKPDNLVMQAYDDPNSPSRRSMRVMIIDFDHADPDYAPGSKSTRQDADSTFGTLRFNSPETFLGEFSQESDLYSVGVILYLLMAGKMPYDDAIFLETEAAVSTRTTNGRRRRGGGAGGTGGGSPSADWKAAVYQRLQESEIDWSCEPWPSQPSCREFCKNLLSFSANFRFSSAEQALEHVWFKEPS